MAEIKDFTCRTCGAQFDGRDKLDKHNRRDHGAHIQQNSGDSGSQRGGQAGSKRLEQHRSGEGEMKSGDDDTNRATESAREEKKAKKERGRS